MIDLANKIEALLFSAAKSFTIEEIEEVLGIKDIEGIKNAIKGLQERHTNSSLTVIEERGGYRFTIKEAYMSIVSKVVEDTELSKTVMETLAVIAWKAPVLQADIIKIRSNKAYDHIAELKEAGFLVKEKFGRSYKIKLAPKFYEYFDIRNKEDIKEKFQEVEERVGEKQQQRMEDMVNKQGVKEKSVQESLEEIRKDAKKVVAEIEKKKEEAIKELKEEKKEMEAEIALETIDEAETEDQVAEADEKAEEEKLEEEGDQEEPEEEKTNEDIEEEKTDEVKEQTEETEKEEIEEVEEKEEVSEEPAEEEPKEDIEEEKEDNSEEIKRDK